MGKKPIDSKVFCFVSIMFCKVKHSLEIYSLVVSSIIFCKISYSALLLLIVDCHMLLRLLSKMKQMAPQISASIIYHSELPQRLCSLIWPDEKISASYCQWPKAALRAAGAFLVLCDLQDFTYLCNLAFTGLHPFPEGISNSDKWWSCSREDHDWIAPFKA